MTDDELPARDQTQSRLRVSELRYRRLFEAARDGILILDAVTLKITDVINQGDQVHTSGRRRAGTPGAK